MIYYSVVPAEVVFRQEKKEEKWTDNPVLPVGAPSCATLSPTKALEKLKKERKYI